MPSPSVVTEEVYQMVIQRDTVQKWLSLLSYPFMTREQLGMPPEHVLPLSETTKREGREAWRSALSNPCMAPALDPSGSGPCSGPVTLDHIHRHAGGTRGKRAASDEQHLVSLCAGHHLGWNDKGGRVWATSHRQLLREYLDVIYGEEDG